MCSPVFSDSLTAAAVLGPVCTNAHDYFWCVGFIFGPSKHRGFSVNPLAMSAAELEDLQRQSGLVGEDAAVFSFEEQSLRSWGAFLAVLGTVLTALYYLWLNPDTGYGEFPLPIGGLPRHKVVVLLLLLLALAL